MNTTLTRVTAGAFASAVLLIATGCACIMFNHVEGPPEWDRKCPECRQDSEAAGEEASEPAGEAANLMVEPGAS